MNCVFCYWRHILDWTMGRLAWINNNSDRNTFFIHSVSVHEVERKQGMSLRIFLHSQTTIKNRNIFFLFFLNMLSGQRPNKLFDSNWKLQLNMLVCAQQMPINWSYIKTGPSIQVISRPTTSIHSTLVHSSLASTKSCLPFVTCTCRTLSRNDYEWENGKKKRKWKYWKEERKKEGKKETHESRVETIFLACVWRSFRFHLKMLSVVCVCACVREYTFYYFIRRKTTISRT